MTQHTPGPWDAEVPPSCMLCTRDIRSEDGKTIALIGYRDYANDVSEDVANARLIAAAPDLLKACWLMLDAVNEHHKDGSILWVSPGTTAWELLTDVIGKATGENLQKSP